MVVGQLYMPSNAVFHEQENIAIAGKEVRVRYKD